MDTRTKIKGIIKTKIMPYYDGNIDNIDKIVEDLERGIYNWTIEFADEKRLVKNWKNSIFLKMYNEKARSVISNIDPTSYIQNTTLITRLKENEFLPHEIPFMKPEHLYPDIWKDTVEDYLKMFEYAYQDKKVAITDLFRCSRCRKSVCSYYSMQTRSSDEPETIFVRCCNCGYQFRC